MNSKQRFLTALGLGIPDRVPMWDWFDEPVVYDVAAELGLIRSADLGLLSRRGSETGGYTELYCDIIGALDVDGTQNVIDTGFTRTGDETGRDRYGRHFMLSTHGEPMVLEPAVRTSEDIAGYDMLSFLSDRDFDGIREVIRRHPDRAHGLNVKGPFAEAWLNIGGMDKLLVAFGSDPKLAHDAMAMSVGWSRAVLDLAAEAGIEFVVTDADLCGNDFPLMSYEHFREFLVPYKRELVEHAHGLGLKVIKHTDGMAWRLMDDFIAIGYDGFHPVQPQCMDLATTKAYLRGRMSVWGNLDCLDLLVFATPERVDAAARQVIAQGAPGGGYVFASSNSLHPGCRAENVIAMFRAGRKYGDYAHIPANLPPAPAPPDTTPVRQRRQTRRRAKAFAG
ncbi:MAG: hypothetical protein GY717_00105 [Rhodobacteraceae bacterium]|nr:hypothetical protein [Paracoccaceae bacterium]